MIIDSVPYKYYLRNEVLAIRGLLQKSARIRSNKKYFQVEKFLFTSAFLIRKLIENKKLSDELETEKIEVSYADVIDIQATRDVMNKWDFWDNYQMETRKKDRLNLITLTNIFIHSHVLLLIPSNIKSKDNTEKIEIVITSDLKANKIFILTLSTYLKICDDVFKDEIVSASYGWKNEGDEYRSVLTKSRNHLIK